MTLVTACATAEPIGADGKQRWGIPDACSDFGPQQIDARKGHGSQVPVPTTRAVGEPRQVHCNGSGEAIGCALLPKLSAASISVSGPSPDDLRSGIGVRFWPLASWVPLPLVEPRCGTVVVGRRSVPTASVWRGLGGSTRTSFPHPTRRKVRNRYRELPPRGGIARPMAAQIARSVESSSSR